MTLEQLSQIGEMVGGIMVVGSLIFVGMQMRLNAKATRAESRRASVDAWSKIAFGIASDHGLAQAVLDDRPDELSVSSGMSVDHMRLINYYAGMLGIVEGQYLLYLDGSLPEETWKGFEKGLILNLTLSKQAHRYWNNSKEMHSERFQALVEDILPRVEERRSELARQRAAASDDGNVEVL